MLKLLLFFTISIVGMSTAYSWSGNSEVQTECKWTERNYYKCEWTGAYKFDYSPTETLYMSASRPVNEKDGVPVTSGGKWWRPGNGSAVGIIGDISSGTLTFSIGADSDADIDGFHSGSFYVWFGRNNTLAKITYTFYYTPLAQISLSNSTLDLGTCHKNSSESGLKLEKDIEIPITLRGYAPDSSYSISRVIKSSDSPEAALYHDKNNKNIILGFPVTLLQSITGVFPSKDGRYNFRKP